VRVFDVLTDLDRVGEHVFYSIEPHDQVTRSGWVGLL
jgi:hypothetical protein